MVAIPSTISGFAVIPVLYNSSTTHILYARPHSSGKAKTKQGDSHKKKSLPDGRTLFLVNIPPDATERELVLFFKHAGTVEKVIFDEETKDVPHDDKIESEDEQDEIVTDEDEEGNIVEPRNFRKGHKDAEIPKVIPLPPPRPPLRKLHNTGQTAHIVFLDVSSLERALASTSRPRAWPSKSSSVEEPMGLAHYQALYASLRPPLDSVRTFADSSMEVYEYNLQKEKQKSQYKKGEAIVDADGFTLVTRGGAYGKTLGGGVGVASKRFQRSVGQTRTRSDKKKEKKEGFYAFHKAEKQQAGKQRFIPMSYDKT
jgi:ribosomal RNA-processing protein 7